MEDQIDSVLGDGEEVRLAFGRWLDVNVEALAVDDVGILVAFQSNLTFKLLIRAVRVSRP